MPLSLLRRHVQRHGDYYRRWRRRYRRLVYRQLLLQTRIECLRVLRRHLRANDPKAALQAAQLLIRLELHRRPSRHKQRLPPSLPQPASLRPERSQPQLASPQPPRRWPAEPPPRSPSPCSAVTDHDLRQPQLDSHPSPSFDDQLSSLDALVRRLDRQQLLRLWERRFRRECRRRGIVIPGVDLADEDPHAAALDDALQLHLAPLADPQLREKLRLALLGPWGDADAPDAPAANAGNANVHNVNACVANACTAYSCHAEACDTPTPDPAGDNTQTPDVHISDATNGDATATHPTAGNLTATHPTAGNPDAPTVAAAGPADAAFPIPPTAPSGYIDSIPPDDVLPEPYLRGVNVMSRTVRCMCVLCAVAVAVLGMLAALLPTTEAAEPAAVQSAPPKDAPVSFIRDVAPVLQEYCFACHDAKKKSGKYDMTTFEKLLAGGVNGEAVIPGKPDESELYTLIVSTEERRMPPRDKGEAVPKEKAQLIARWIAQGAKLDAGISPQASLPKELRVRWQPPEPPKVYPYPAIINAMVFTPDGKQLVTGGHHELNVWDASTGQLLRRIRTRAERAYGMVFLPDGLLAVAGGRPGQEGDLRIYNIQANGPVIDGVVYLDGVHDPNVLRKHLFDVDDAVLCVAATPDGKLLAAGGCDRIVRVFDLSKGLDHAQLTQTVENHADWVLGCALTANGKYLLTAGRDKTAKVWDLQAKESVVTFPEHQNIVYGVAARPDGSLGYSVGADRQIRAWKPDGSGKQAAGAGGHGDEVFKIAIHPQGAMLATGSADRTVRLWEPNKLATLRQLQGPTDHVFAVAFSPDGQLVAAGCFNGEVLVWKTADGTLVRRWNASPGWKPEPPKK